MELYGFRKQTVFDDKGVREIKVDIFDTDRRYDVIYADPPWAYRTYSKKGQGRSAESHYPTMCIEDIKALPMHIPHAVRNTEGFIRQAERQNG